MPQQQSLRETKGLLLPQDWIHTRDAKQELIQEILNCSHQNGLAWALLLASREACVTDSEDWRSQITNELLRPLGRLCWQWARKCGAGLGEI